MSEVPPTRALPTVLMVEDDAEFANDTTAILAGSVTVRRVGGTAAAAAHILRQKPDVLWLDLELEPFFSDTSATEGLAFLKAVRERIDHELPVVVVSGQLADEMRSLLGQFGVVACFTKPPDMAALVDALRRPSRAPGA